MIQKLNLFRKEKKDKYKKEYMEKNYIKRELHKKRTSQI